MQNKIPSEVIDTKQRILRAAARIINTTGVLSLTLETVAKEAKISKGGLLYHFPNKDALMKGMADYLIQGFTNEVVCVASEDSCEKGKWTRAYTKVTFNQLESELDMNVAILAAIATNPELLKSISKHLQVLQDRIENDHIDQIVSTIIRLAVDGIYFNHLYGMSLREDVYEKVLNYLISLTEVS
ncbi:transcriptional regulator, TetR family [Desulfofarcimen acetoxidans DSM 771]|uniref:Transcriptional regulator, TetR family n=1 Tax=Desulfofarcimen acetoxidans (strain ATCC 49208 / DSM 771 / KCTC 5769 / VKM B-1644 / 5575) TaxID=485916 RepID=C8W1U0_DESAS|nr:TetR/AcrR family transcriptional regulator [Desulfofarcimen acetoxidans]ACV63561.1 transcriptional regulator, TetR family [Desulfofarcimen acetoxidans DSM 771]